MTLKGEGDKFESLMLREGDVMHTNEIKTDIVLGRENMNDAQL
jgi:hypothetical protein